MMEFWRIVRTVMSRHVDWGEGGIVRVRGAEVILSAVSRCDLPRRVLFVCQTV